jgi:integrase
VPTLAAVLIEYLAARKLSTKSSADLRSVIGVHGTAWADKPIDGLEARAVATRYRAVAAVSPGQGVRLLAALSALTRFAHAAHGVGDATLIQRVRALLGGTEEVVARDVVIPDDVQGEWAKAVAGESVQVARYFRALMFTGLRANELRKLPRSGWDGDAGVINIATTKNGKPHALPTGTALRALIDEEARSTADDACLFDVPVKVYRAACERVGGAVGIDWHLHDMRRTFATVATRAGVDAGMVKRLMNHSTSGDVTAHHYVRLNVEDMRPSMQIVETRLHALWAAA